MTRRYRDPLRVIVKRVNEGTGTDQLRLLCGHTVVKNHRPKWGRRTSCSQCREWLE